MSTVSLNNIVMSRAVPRLRLTRRGRAVFTIIGAIPLVIVALAFGLNGVVCGGGAAIASLDGASVSFEYVTVQAGQSLWELAEEFSPNADPRDVIMAIMKLNQLESSDVRAGQQLAMPQRQ